MKVKTKGLISQISGTIGGIDRTIGREGGLSANIQTRRTASVMVSKKKATTGGSVARHKRSCDYLGCDTDYKTIGKVKQKYVKIYYQAAWDVIYTRHTNYFLFMKLCLLKVLELEAFKNFSYFSRFLIHNTTGEDWNDKIVILLNIPVFRADGKDCWAHVLDNKDHISYEIPHKVETVGTCSVKINQLPNFNTLVIDVYSYGKIAFPEGF